MKHMLSIAVTALFAASGAPGNGDIREKPQNGGLRGPRLHAALEQLAADALSMYELPKQHSVPDIGEVPAGMVNKIQEKEKRIKLVHALYSNPVPPERVRHTFTLKKGMSLPLGLGGHYGWSVPPKKNGGPARFQGNVTRKLKKKFKNTTPLSADFAEQLRTKMLVGCEAIEKKLEKTVEKKRPPRFLQVSSRTTPLFKKNPTRLSPDFVEQLREKLLKGT